MDTIADALTCRFDDFAIDLKAGVVCSVEPGGEAVQLALGSRAFDILCFLVRHSGVVVSRHEILDAVWPNVLVEDNNLTVQVSALRRVLDTGRANRSCIQTIPGRGYRFVPRVTWSRQGAHSDASAAAVPCEPPHRASFEPGSAVDRVSSSRLSIVVLPFRSLSGDSHDDYLADGITNDLSSDLSHLPEAFVIDNASARTYAGETVDAKQIGQELGVRYVVEGSVRRIGTMLRVNTKLISTDTGGYVWSDRFDEHITDLAEGQGAILARMRGALGINLVEIEAARGLRTPPSTPDAFDLILRARALRNQTPSQQRANEIVSLYERALELDPLSVVALTGIAFYLIEQRAYQGYWRTYDKLRRAEELLRRARAIAPASEEVLVVETYWLKTTVGCHEAVLAARRLIDLFPNNRAGYNWLAWCRTATGHAEEERPLLEKLIRLNPRDPYLFNLYRRMGYAALLLGQDEEAIPLLERSLALEPEARVELRPTTYRQLAAAYARTGDAARAGRALAEADRLRPFHTVRGHSPDDLNPTNMSQIRRYQDGLRLAGARDHADEDADFGVITDAGLSRRLVGHTPMTVTGAVTIRTADLPRFIDERKPVIIDCLLNFWGHSLPGAVGLRNAGIGGSVSDGAQECLGREMADLTGGDLSKPVVAVGWNSERFDGHNLALRLVALGCTNVVWYRGGREAWEVAGLPVSEVVLRDL